MKTEVKDIPFNDGSLLGVRTPDGKVWLAVKKACSDIGLTEKQANNEVEKIKKELLYNSCTLNLGWRLLKVKLDSQSREIIVLAEDFVPMWLAKISLTPTMKQKNPKAVEKLLEYQLNAKDVLHKAFYETEEQKSTLHSKLGLEGRIEGMQVQINSMENMLCEQMEKLDSVMDNMTLSTRQQQKLYKAAKDRINHLLGGAHSPEYKEKSKSYFINLWNGLKSLYGCASYKDLNPKYYNEAFDYIIGWKYIEV